jgi:hypothetical protein
MRRVFPRSGYLHTPEWATEMIEARLHLPWLAFRVRFARAAVIIALVWAAAGLSGSMLSWENDVIRDERRQTCN